MRTHPQELRSLLQVVRHFGGEGHESGGGVADAQAEGVEQGPVKLEALALRSGQETRPSVARVAGKRQSNRGEMHPYLMGPPRLRKSGDERASPEPFEHAVSGLRRLSRRIDASLAWHGAIGAEREVDGPFLVPWLACEPGPILLLAAPSPKPAGPPGL